MRKSITSSKVQFLPPPRFRDAHRGHFRAARTTHPTQKPLPLVSSSRSKGALSNRRPQSRSAQLPHACGFGPPALTRSSLAFVGRVARAALANDPNVTKGLCLAGGQHSITIWELNLLMSCPLFGPSRSARSFGRGVSSCGSPMDGELLPKTRFAFSLFGLVIGVVTAGMGARVREPHNSPPCRGRWI
jgi:hypothetical protein